MSTPLTPEQIEYLRMLGIAPQETGVTKEPKASLPNQSPSVGTRVESLLRGISQGATYGFADEGIAVASQMVGPTSRRFLGELMAPEGQEEAYGQAAENLSYSDVRDSARRQVNQSLEQAPGQFIAGTVGGALATGQIATAAAPAAANVGAAQGAAEGVLAGAGSSEAAIDSPEFYRDLAVGGGIGGGVGAAMRGLKSFLRTRGMPAPDLDNTVAPREGFTPRTPRAPTDAEIIPYQVWPKGAGSLVLRKHLESWPDIDRMSHITLPNAANEMIHVPVGMQVLDKYVDATPMNRIPRDVREVLREIKANQQFGDRAGLRSNYMDDVTEDSGVFEIPALLRRANDNPTPAEVIPFVRPNVLPEAPIATRNTPPSSNYLPPPSPSVGAAGASGASALTEADLRALMSLQGEDVE